MLFNIYDREDLQALLAVANQWVAFYQKADAQSTLNS